MTEAQRRTIEHIDDLLTEHFDAAVCIYMIDDDKGGSETFMTYTGGAFRAIGVMEQMKHDLIDKKRRADSPEP
jgi:hypothetical protein